MARALEVPMYRLFHDGEVPASLSKLKPPKDDDEFGSRGAQADYLSKLRRLLAKMEPGDQKSVAAHGPKSRKRLARIVPPRVFARSFHWLLTWVNGCRVRRQNHVTTRDSEGIGRRLENRLGFCRAACRRHNRCNAH